MDSIILHIKQLDKLGRVVLGLFQAQQYTKLFFAQYLICLYFLLVGDG